MPKSVKTNQKTTTRSVRFKRQRQDQKEKSSCKKGLNFEVKICLRHHQTKVNHLNAFDNHVKAILLRFKQVFLVFLCVKRISLVENFHLDRLGLFYK